MSSWGYNNSTRRTDRLAIRHALEAAGIQFIFENGGSAGVASANLREGNDGASLGDGA